MATLHQPLLAPRPRHTRLSALAKRHEEETYVRGLSTHRKRKCQAAMENRRPSELPLPKPQVYGSLVRIEEAEV